MSSRDDGVSRAGAGRHGPDAAEVGAELARVLASGCFEQAGRAKDFLRFVVEETLAGRAHRLKGYTIAVEVFGRSADFDAQADPLVRVEAGRLRRRLTEYYATEGQRNPLRIGLPRGGYAATFERAAPAAEAPSVDAPRASASSPPAANAKTAGRPSAQLLAAAGAVTVAAGIAALAWFLFANAPEASKSLPGLELPRGPTLVVSPFRNLSDSSDLDYLAYGITEELILDLNRFDLLVIAPVVESAPGAQGAERQSAYVLTGTLRYTPERLRITARLATPTGEQLWSEAFDDPADVATLLTTQERIAEQVARAVAAPFGPIFRAEIAETTRKPAQLWDTYDCVLRYHYYRRTFDPRDHALDADCFERAVAREPLLADAWAGLALVYVDEGLYGYNPRPGAPPLVRAREAASKALDIEGENRLANLAMARVRHASGDIAGFERIADRLLEMSPNNPDDLATIGALRGIAGDWERGLPLIDKALALGGPGHSPYAIGLALYALQIGDYDTALARALEVDTPNWYIAAMTLAACAALAGRQDIAERSMARLRALKPDFAFADVQKWRPTEALVAQLRAGLTAAGLD
jgi:TolB-like protein